MSSHTMTQHFCVVCRDEDRSRAPQTFAGPGTCPVHAVDLTENRDAYYTPVPCHADGTSVDTRAPYAHWPHPCRVVGCPGYLT